MGDFPTGDWDDDLKVTSLVKAAGLGSESRKMPLSLRSHLPGICFSKHSAVTRYFFCSFMCVHTCAYLWAHMSMCM